MKTEMKYPKSRVAAALAVMAVAGCVFGSQAAPVSPEEAASIAGDFLKNRVEALRTRGAAPEMKTVYTSRADNGAESFFILNDEEAGCYAIVAADDRLPKVLGWSDKGCFDPDDIPANVRWWLGEYDVEISAMLKADPKVPATRSIYEPDYRAKVDPMLKSTWDQSTPYNNMCPTIGGRRSVTGCVATAMAQVMRYHAWPDYPTGANKDYTFTGTQLDWSLMIDAYYTGGYTTRQANAVALLMLQCGRSVDMAYTPNESGAQGNKVAYALTTFFDYSQDLRLHYRDYYSSSVWEDMVYSELQEKRPVLYFGYSYAGGHAFVCDGYLDGYYHFNWGWGGYQDGYFLLNALNPAAGGIGSYIGGYNLNQSIYTGVQKNNGSTDRQYLMLANGGFVYDHDRNAFAVKPQDSGQGFMYNPLAYSFTMNVGLKMVDASGKVAGYASNRERADLLPGYGYDVFRPEMPSLPAGTYRAYPAFCDPNMTWRDIQTLYGSQQYCEVTYDSKGDYIISNPGAPADMKADFVLSDPTVSTAPAPGMPVAVSYYVTNIGPGDYTGFVFGALAGLGQTPSEDNMDIAILSLARGQTERVSFSIPAPDAKEADLMILDSDMNPIGKSTQLRLDGTATDKRAAARKLDVMMLSPTEATVGNSASVSIFVQNLTDEVVPVSFFFECFDEFGERVGHFSSQELKIPAGYANTINFGTVDLTLEPGWYRWQVSEMNGEAAGNLLSLPSPMQVVNGPKTFEFKSYYTIVGEDEALFSRPPIGSYSEEMVVTEKIEGQTITGFEGNAFVNSPKLTALTVPATVNRLGSALLYMTPELTDLTVMSPEPPAISADVMEPYAFNRVWLHTPAGTENLYMHSEVWSKFSMGRWFFSFPKEVEITGLDNDPGTGSPYQPYFIDDTRELTFDISLPEGMSAIVGWNIGETELKGYTCYGSGKVTLPALGRHYGSAYMTLVDSASVSDAEAVSGLADVYTTTGLPVLRQAAKSEIDALPAGIYIVNGKKTVVR